jgi:hypothetical protein
MNLIPGTTAAFFQEYRFESLDVAADAALIMSACWLMEIAPKYPGCSMVVQELWRG